MGGKEGSNGLKKALGLLSYPVFDIVRSPIGFYFIVGIAFLLCFLFSGIVFGFVPLENVMIDNGIHSNLCEDTTNDFSPSPSPSPTPSPSDACSAQLLKLYMMYTIATTLLNLLSLPSGFVVDHLGSRPSAILSLMCLCLSFCIFALGGYTFGYTLMGCSGVLMYMSLFYLADFNESKRGLVIGLIAGGFNSSAVTFLILEPMEWLGLNLAESFFIFAGMSVVMLVIVFLFFPRSQGKWEKKGESQQRLGDDFPSSVSIQEEDVSQGITEETETKERKQINPPLAHLTFPQQLLTIDNVLLVFSLAFSNLFVLFYQSTIDQQLDSMNPDKPSLASSYTSLFFLLLPIITAVGIVVTSGALTYSSVAAMTVGRVLLAISSFVILIPFIKLQLIGFILLPLGNLLLWSTTPDMILRVFGPTNFGTLFGFGMTISGPISALSFLFVYLSLSIGSWVYVDFFLFILQLVLMVVPFYFWRTYYQGEVERVEGDSVEEDLLTAGGEFESDENVNR